MWPRTKSSWPAYLQREVNNWLLGHAVPNERYQDSIRKRLHATCEWIFTRAEFVHWLDRDTALSSSPLLWINGHAGFGKTILCARIVQQLMTKAQFPVAHFFFSSEFASRDDMYVAVRSWISQLASEHPVAFELARDEWEIATDEAFISKATALRLLKAICLRLPDCTLIIDGLDECAAGHDGQKTMELLLDDIRASMAKSTRVMIVSRDEPGVRQALGGDVGYAEIKISAEDVRNDTVLLSQHIVDRRLPKKSADIRQDLSESMSCRCDGQFLWIMMQELSLRRGMNYSDLKRAISETPTQLDQVYDRYWKAIMALSARDRDRAFSLLRWAAFSVRPLTVCEISEAVLLNESCDGISVDGLPDDIDEDYVDTEIVGLCGPLIEVRSQSSESAVGQHTVHVAHFTVKQFLIHQLPTKTLQANQRLQSTAENFHGALLGLLCLRYIRSRLCWGDIRLKNVPRVEGHFRLYAAKWWHSHLLDAGDDGLGSDTLQLVKDFMSESHPCWDFWRRWFDDQDEDGTAKYELALSQEPLGPLYYAVRMNMSSLAASLIHSNVVPIEEMDRGWSAFNRACHKGDRTLVQAFVDAKAHIGPHKTHSTVTTTPLHCAAVGGSLDVIETLLDSGADLSVTNNFGSTPLHYAAYYGNAQVIRLLLLRGANISALDAGDRTPLHIATYFGHLDAVQTLLSFKADTSATCDDDSCSPLHIAAVYGHLDIGESLLNHGAWIGVSTRHNWKPLHFATKFGHVELIRRLIQAGANVSDATDQDWTPLHFAAYFSSAEVVRLLIENRADLSARDNRGWTALHIAASCGAMDTVELLLENGADVSVSCNSGRAPLHLAAVYQPLECIDLLLKKGALDSAKDNGGMTPLMLAAQGGNVDAVRLLLREAAASLKGGLESAIEPVDFVLNQTDNHGRTALFFASQFGSLDVVHVILAVDGIQLMATDFYGSTAFHTAVINGHAPVVKALLGSGSVSMDLCDGFGRPISWWASRSRNPEVQQILLQYAAQRDISLHLEEVPTVSDHIDSNRNAAWCDACTLCLAHESQRYQCATCDEGGFCLCVECVAIGVHCRNKDHSLIHT